MIYLVGSSSRGVHHCCKLRRSNQCDRRVPERDIDHFTRCSLIAAISRSLDNDAFTLCGPTCPFLHFHIVRHIAPSELAVRRMLSSLTSPPQHTGFHLLGQIKTADTDSRSEICIHPNAYIVSARVSRAVSHITRSYLFCLFPGVNNISLL